MSGRLKETCFSTVKERQQSDQTSLSEYSDDEQTFVAVVSCPRGGIEKYVDELWPEVGMPERILKKFLARRSGYQTNSAIDNPHNQAYEEMNLTEAYRDHLNQSVRASERISEATERLLSGENITLVCYEPDGKSCHRHILIDIINMQVESRENSQFTLRA